MVGTKSPKKKAARPFVSRTVYKQAANTVKKLLEADKNKTKGVTLKSLVFHPSVVGKKATYALTCETLRYLPVIKELVASTGSWNLHSKRNEGNEELIFVLVYELLFGLGEIPSNGHAEKFVHSQKNALRASLARLLVKRKVSSPKELLPPQSQASEPDHPRFVRVNTLKISLQEAMHSLKNFDVSLDDLVPNLLVLPPGSDLHAHPLVLDGSLVLQGKASCLPAVALNPKPEWKVIDACAAPGNKTSHLAAIMEGKGKIIACELNPVRLDHLRKRLQLMSASNVEARLQDFLAIDPQSEGFRDTDAVLLDPSCSGSGTARQRMDHLLPSAYEGSRQEDSTERLEQLARFQEAALRHALSFPNVKRVVYSTCSVHQREDEDVVQSVLASARGLGFHLASALPGWPHRGLPLFDGAQHLLRMESERDKTDGFFVALFVRSSEPSEVAENGSNSKDSRKKIQAVQASGDRGAEIEKKEVTQTNLREGLLRRRRMKKQRKKAAAKAIG